MQTLPHILVKKNVCQKTYIRFQCYTYIRYPYIIKTVVRWVFFPSIVHYIEGLASLQCDTVNKDSIHCKEHSDPKYNNTGKSQ